MRHYEEQVQTSENRDQMFIKVGREFCDAIVNFEKDKDRLFGEASGEAVTLCKVHFWNRKLKRVLKALAECSNDPFDWNDVSEIKISCYGALPIDPEDENTAYHRPELIVTFMGRTLDYDYAYTELGEIGHVYFDKDDLPGFGTPHRGCGPRPFKNNPGMAVFAPWLVDQFPKIEAAFQELADKHNALKQQQKDAETKMCEDALAICEDALAKMKASKNAYEWQRKVKMGWVKQELTP